MCCQPKGLTINIFLKEVQNTYVSNIYVLNNICPERADDFREVYYGLQNICRVDFIKKSIRQAWQKKSRLKHKKGEINYGKERKESA